ncbi:MAG: metallophosphoesterase [Spirochaetes bacterium]|nr:metallophosphoesterase [Spirochaetota bacterium]
MKGQTAGGTVRSETGRRRALPAAVLALAALLAGCATAGPGAGPSPAPVGYPAIRFAVIADPHLFDVTTSSPGPAFDRAVDSDMKLYAESREILAQALADIAAERPDFLLVCGDLTHDGERSAHELAAAMLGRLDAAGVPVLVVPGNHDVLNPRAARFSGETAEPVAGVTPEDFAAIHADLGYREALERDPASLSYVAEPVPGLRVLALDACRYLGEPGSPRTDGRLPRATRAWAVRVLARARADGAATIVFLHHAVIPHFAGMERWLDAYLLDGHDAAARFLAGAGVHLAFTGHVHAQDIVRGTTAEGPVWDVETGSLVSWPNPWRLVEVGPGAAVRISSRRVTVTPSRGATFASHAELRLAEGLRDEALALLARRGVHGEPALAIARRVVVAFSAFFAGDEPGPVAPVDRSVLGPWSRLAEAAARQLLDAIGTDLEPADNDVSFTVD